MSPLRLRIDGTRFRDQHNREITIHGINVSGDAKLPSTPDQPSHIKENFFDGDNVSFTGRPFPAEDAHAHFARLRSWGYNTIRYVYTWEAIEAKGPGKYDEAWISHTIDVLRIAKEYGFFVFMDPHQDVWSRFTGGSGAPMWTIYACGFDPAKLAVGEAALVHNTWPNSDDFPKMIWATNYQRLACQTIFTMFFGGRVFAPKCIIDGVNIQDYLQQHFLQSIEHLAKRIKEAGGLEDEVIIGWENINEPNRGHIGTQKITEVPSEQKLRLGTSPTVWQSILLGSGRPCEVEVWAIGNMGPYKSGSTLIDPEGTSAWLSPDDDKRYGWTRDPGWKLGECVWAQHGVWDPQTDSVLKDDYFAKDPRTRKTIDYEGFTNTFFMDYYRDHVKSIRGIYPQTILICQPPTNEIAPMLIGTSDEDANTVYAPHFYDGLTLMMKKWNRFWNIDVFGVLRGKYSHPAFAIKIGETAIRNCFRDELAAMCAEGREHLGGRPCIFGEIGIPFDMNSKDAYTNGDYSQQIAAMDANMFAIEASGVNGMTLWVYTAENNHLRGDQWNGEDLSLYSKEDRQLGLYPGNGSATSLDPASPSYSRSISSSNTTPSNLKKTYTSEDMQARRATDTTSGFRAVESWVRPTAIVTHGNVVSYGFDLRSCTFKLCLSSSSATKQEAPTEIALPEFHFPQKDTSVEVSGGKWAISTEDIGQASLQILRWWHAEGEQKITVQGVKRKAGAIVDAEDEGYVEQCQQQSGKCNVM